ncbi:MAG: aminodeoxychorismate/anthranilate synthase component II [Myxococcales bacterium]|nr:aminodeoxychorismate/anthranilate synthase component II [Deltaproteobacteria bacterium]NNE17926.1 aminodeoxychorismate/anthranilate synthase component II [Myxococcales bacterium]
MILVIDNYDSFTYNLVQYLSELGAEVVVQRNDAIGVDDVRALGPTGVLISPGPGRPEEAGVSLDVIAELGSATPIFGVCLGHQSIAQHFGASVVRADRLMHGRTSEILHEGHGVFENLPSPLTATRYHSLIVKRDTIPDAIQVTAWTDRDEVMGIRHAELPIEGVQFHPESFLTEHGHHLIRNWLKSLPDAGAS